MAPLLVGNDNVARRDVTVDPVVPLELAQRAENVRSDAPTAVRVKAEGIFPDRVIVDPRMYSSLTWKSASGGLMS